MDTKSMKLHKYSSYEEYRKAQEATNIRKLHKNFRCGKELRIFAHKILKPMNPQFGICHGTRRGIEQDILSKALGCPVIGTEISTTATQFPNTIQWDFHEVKDEWLGSVDFIYSNSWDHAMDPVRAIGNWLRCLSPVGICILEYNDMHRGTDGTESDPFRGSLEELIVFLKSNFKADIRSLHIGRCEYCIIKPL